MHLHYLHLHHFPSLPFSLTVLLVWVIAFILPHATCMSHRTPFSPRTLSSVSLFLFTSLTSPTVELLSRIYSHPFMILNLVNSAVYLNCFWSYDLYSTDFKISFCVNIMNAFCPCKVMMSSTYLDSVGGWWKTVGIFIAVKQMSFSA